MIVEGVGSLSLNIFGFNTIIVDFCCFVFLQKREMELYEDLNNCFGPLEQKYHSEILKLR